MPARLGDISAPGLFGTVKEAKLKWRSWDSRKVTSRGVEQVDLCDPYCAAGTYRYYPVNIELHDPHRLGTARYRVRDLHGQYVDH
jgi:hypothetical protein